MSKEIKMVEQHWLLSAAIHKAKNISRIQCLPKGGDPKEHWCGILVGEIERLTEENAALREALRLKEAECESLSSDISRIVSAAADAHLSGSEQQHVDHLYRVIHDVSGRLYNDDSRGDDENQQAD